MILKSCINTEKVVSEFSLFCSFSNAELDFQAIDQFEQKREESAVDSQTKKSRNPMKILQR